VKRSIALLLAIIFCFSCFTIGSSARGLGRYKVIADSLNFRAQPVSGAVITTLHFGDEIEVTEIKDGWGKAVWNGKTGWCSLRYLVYLDGEVYETSESGLDLIKGFEGFSKFAYWDYSQWTIGYGTRCEEGEYPDGITEEEAEALLRREVVSYELSVNSFLSYNGILLTQNQFDALVSLTYNIGSKWTNGSTLADYLINGIEKYTAEEISAAFGQYIHAGGEVIPGLVERRRREAEYFLSDEHFHSYKAQSGVEATCTSEGEMTYRCYCGAAYTKKLERTDHVASDFFVTLEPTKDSVGMKMARCVMCGEEMLHTEIPKIMSDINESAWYYEGAKYCITEGYITGTGEGLFAPSHTLTREQFVVMLARVADADLSKYKNGSFKDVKSSAWYSASVNWAAKCGYVKGVDDGSAFGVGRSITRQELCVMFYRFSEAKGLNVTPSYDMNRYSDHSDIASWAKKETAFAVSFGLMSSTSSDSLTFSPKMTVTRAQAAKIFMSFDNYRFS